MTDVERSEIFTDELYPAIEQEIRTAVHRVGDDFGVTHQVLTGFLDAYPARETMLLFPLLVHGAQTGDPRPAVPVSAIHVLWLTSARFLDDFADGCAGLDPKTALLASILCSHAVPMNIVFRLGVSDGLRSSLAADLSECSISGVEGQLREFRADPTAASCDAVLRCYRHKNGAGFAMTAAMTARLAGVDAHGLDLWREFGLALGALRQLRNDQEDLLSGRNEDLKNRVVTYLFSYARSRSTEHAGRRLVALLHAAPTSPSALEELRELLLDPELIRGFLEEVDQMRTRLHHILDELGGDRLYSGALRRLIDSSARPHPLLADVRVIDAL